MCVFRNVVEQNVTVPLEGTLLLRMLLRWAAGAAVASTVSSQPCSWRMGTQIQSQITNLVMPPQPLGTQETGTRTGTPLRGNLPLPSTAFHKPSERARSCKRWPHPVLSSTPPERIKFAFRFLLARESGEGTFWSLNFSNSYECGMEIK